MPYILPSMAECDYIRDDNLLLLGSTPVDRLECI